MSFEFDASLIMATALTPAWRIERVLDGPYSKRIQRTHAVAASTGGGALLFMGWCGGICSSGEVYELRRSSKHVATERQSEIIPWSVRLVKTGTPGPEFHYGNACVMFGKMFVIWGVSRAFGGNDALFALNLGKYISMRQRRHKLIWHSIDRLEWSSYCPKVRPPARLLHTMSGVGSTLYVFGGGTIQGQFLNDIYAFDLHEFDDGWHLLPVHGSVPAPRKGHTMVVHEENLYM